MSSLNRHTSAPPDGITGGRIARWLGYAALAVVLLLTTCMVGGFFVFRGSSPYDDAVERATADRRVEALLGAPVNAATFFSGGMRSHNGAASSKLKIELSGSLQTGTLYVDAIKTSGVWGFNHLRVVAADGSQVDVLRHF